MRPFRAIGLWVLFFTAITLSFLSDNKRERKRERAQRQRQLEEAVKKGVVVLLEPRTASR